MQPSKQRRDPSKNLVGFIVGDIEYAVPIERVREITNPIPVLPLPHAPPAITGVAEYRGEVVPVVDLRMRFGLAPHDRARKTKWIVVSDHSRFVALVVDTVTEVFGSGTADILPPPTLGGGEDERGLLGVTKHDGAVVFIIDTRRYSALAEQVVMPPEFRDRDSSQPAFDSPYDWAKGRG